MQQVAQDSVSFSDSAVAQAITLNVANDTVAFTDSAVASIVASGQVDANDTIVFTDSATSFASLLCAGVDNIVFSDSAVCIGPSSNTISTYVAGTGRDDTGRMTTVALGVGNPLPGGFRYIEGFAHDDQGRRYVVPGPIERYINGLAARADGVQVVLPDVTPDKAVTGIPTTTQAETVVTENTPTRGVDGFGLDTVGRMSVVDKLQ